MKKTDKTKNRLGQLLGILLYLLVGGGCGLLIVQFLDRFMTKDIPAGKAAFLFFGLLFWVYIALILQIVIHESGHLVFGLLTGYKFNSFRIFGWIWLKTGDGIRLKHLSIAGTGGQCLMGPPDLQDGKIPFLLYNFGGAIMNLISGLLFLGISFLLPQTSILKVLLQILALTGAALGVINGAPLHLGLIDNDGCNAMSLIQDPKAVRAFWLQMKANELTSRGLRLRDMPEEWFTVPKDETLDNNLVASAAVLASNRLLDEHKFEEADALMEHLLSMDSKLIGLYRNLMICDRLFIELIGQNRKEIVDLSLTKEQKKFMKTMRTFPSVLRTEYTIALLHDNDKEKTENIRKQFEKISRTYPYPSEIEGEAELMKIAKEHYI